MMTEASLLQMRIENNIVKGLLFKHATKGVYLGFSTWLSRKKILRGNGVLKQTLKLIKKIKCITRYIYRQTKISAAMLAASLVIGSNYGNFCDIISSETTLTTMNNQIDFSPTHMGGYLGKDDVFPELSSKAYSEAAVLSEENNLYDDIFFLPKQNILVEKNLGSQEIKKRLKESLSDFSEYPPRMEVKLKTSKAEKPLIFKEKLNKALFEEGKKIPKLDTTQMEETLEEKWKKKHVKIVQPTEAEKRQWEERVLMSLIRFLKRGGRITGKLLKLWLELGLGAWLQLFLYQLVMLVVYKQFLWVWFLVGLPVGIFAWTRIFKKFPHKFAIFSASFACMLGLNQVDLFLIKEVASKHLSVSVLASFIKVCYTPFFILFYRFPEILWVRLPKMIVSSLVGHLMPMSVKTLLGTKMVENEYLFMLAVNMCKRENARSFIRGLYTILPHTKVFNGLVKLCPLEEAIRLTMEVMPYSRVIDLVLSASKAGIIDL